MSNNQTIQDDLKIAGKEETKNNYKNETPKGEDESFIQLLSLQLLIQRHSGLKELCNLFYHIYFKLFY